MRLNLKIMQISSHIKRRKECLKVSKLLCIITKLPEGRFKEDLLQLILKLRRCTLVYGMMAIKENWKKKGENIKINWLKSFNNRICKLGITRVYVTVNKNWSRLKPSNEKACIKKQWLSASHECQGIDNTQPSWHGDRN